MSYHVRLAEPADRAPILDLLTELHLPPGADEGRSEIERRYAWLYEQNPHGKALTWVAVDDETKSLAGCSSFFPRTLELDGKPVRGALGGDGFVRPRFRRRGIATALHAAGRRDMRALGVEVMFGTPMPANLTPLSMAGSRNITFVARYARPLSLRALGVKSRAANRLASALLVPKTRARLDPAARGDARVEAVCQRARARRGIATRRDAELYAWRFTEAPSQRQRAFVVVEGGSPIAACATERVGGALRVVDLVAPPEKWGEALRAVCREADGCDAVDLRLTRDEARALGLRRMGFFERGGVMPLNVVLSEGNAGADVFWDPRRWRVSWMETDLDTAA
jgi:GNAT superfamily N-acetyltransferase